MPGESVQDFFNQETGQFKKGLKPGTDPKIEYLSKKTRDGDRVLDVGCGSGAFLEYVLEKTPASKGYGIDISSGMLPDNAGKKSGYILGDAQSIPFKESSFDTVHLDTVLHHVVGRTRAEYKRQVIAVLGEIRRVLKPGGDLVLTERVQRGRFLRDVHLSLAIFYTLKYASFLAKPFYRRARIQQPPISFYSENEIFQMLLESGFSIVDSDHISYRDHQFLRRIVQSESKRINFYASLLE